MSGSAFLKHGSLDDLEAGSSGASTHEKPSSLNSNGNIQEGGGSGGEDSAATWQQDQRRQEGQQWHCWEDAIFQGHPITHRYRHSLRFNGKCQPSEQPLVLAEVTGIDHKGQPFCWLARRHRKHVAHPHQCPSPPPPIAWLGWLDAHKHASNPSWWVGLAFTVGSILFVVSGVAGVIPSLGNAPDPGLWSLAAALTVWVDIVGSNLLFLPAGLLQLFEAVNMDYQSRLRAWEKGGGASSGAPRPSHCLLPSRQDMQTISFWAVVIQVSGMLGFGMATVFNFVGTAVALNPTVAKWTTAFGFCYGGAAFTASAVLFCREATGSWWRGLVPSRLSDLRSISWHSAFWGIQGSIGFLISGAGNYADSFSWTQQQWIDGNHLFVGALGGAVWFLLSSFALLVEQANPQHP